MTRPLIVTDCDGVLLDFIAPFQTFLGREHGMTLTMDSFAIAGNLRDADGHEVPIQQFPALLDQFFTNHMPTQTPIAGAAEALATLAAFADVVVLTNVAEKHALTRTHELDKLGMPYRVVGNNGPKGKPLRHLVEHFGATRAVFIDDLPPHHSSARQVIPEVHRLHMVAEAPLRLLIPPAADADARIDEWPAALAHIRTVLEI